MAEEITGQTLDQAVIFVKELSRRTGSVIVITGAMDLVSDSRKCYVIRNGRPEMSKITGTGCQLSALITAFITANPEHILEASAAAVGMMGLAGEIGWSRMQPGEGNASYRTRIINAIDQMDEEILRKGANYEMR
jgi:hydroxyethylthiazole kinase